jgi:hypothetical protein
MFFRRFGAMTEECGSVLNEVYLVQMYGNFDMPFIIGVATDMDEAKKIMKKYSERWGGPAKKIIAINEFEFKYPDSSDVDFTIRKVKVNKLI